MRDISHSSHLCVADQWHQRTKVTMLIILCLYNVITSILLLAVVNLLCQIYKLSNHGYKCIGKKQYLQGLVFCGSRFRSLGCSSCGLKGAILDWEIHKQQIFLYPSSEARKSKNSVPGDLMSAEGLSLMRIAFSVSSDGEKVEAHFFLGHQSHSSELCPQYLWLPNTLSLTVQSQDMTWGRAHSDHADLLGREAETHSLLRVCDTKPFVRFWRSWSSLPTGQETCPERMSPKGKGHLNR